MFDYLRCVCSSLCGLLLTLPVSAQIIPDTTLGNENTTLTPINPNRYHIDGGAIRDINLFHSFLEFNIQQNQTVYFSNPLGVENILTRVTGNNLSDINGRLGVAGEANLFLLNPNGIIFGENASLDIRGSFLATTADS
ncbi:MAG: filamentous hemagglutinin N-terminal domain-containing protein, partial [Spirulinaceae cyanobacterium]